MANYPHPETPYARAMWCVEHHRTHELQVDGLTAEELGGVRAVIARRLLHARARQLKNRATEVILAIIFVALGVFLAIVGPAMTGPGDGLMIYSKALLYGFLIVFLVIGVAGGDYLLRRRGERARGLARAVRDLTDAMAQVDDALRAR